MNPPVSSAALRVLLGFLRAGRVLDGGSSALLLGGLVLATSPNTPARLALAAAVLGLGLIEKYYAWRVALDAEFFAWLNERPAAVEEFDAALGAFLGRKNQPAPREMADRWRGARRLVGCQAAALALQAAGVLALVVW